MDEWATNLWHNQSDGHVHSYAGTGDDLFVGAAEALAHFSILAERPNISLDSRIEVKGFHGAAGPDSVFTVRGLLAYLEDDSSILAGLDDSNRQRLLRLAEELKN